MDHQKIIDLNKKTVNITDAIVRRLNLESEKAVMVDFNEYYNLGKTCWQVFYHDRIDGYSSKQECVCVESEQVATSIKLAMDIYNAALEKTREVVAKRMLSKSEIQELPMFNNIEYDFGYCYICVYERNKAEEDAEIAQRQDSFEDGPYGGAFASQEDFFRWKEGH